MLNKFFSGDNMLFKIFSVLADVLAFSVLWLVCAVTVVGLGPGTTALYDAMARHLRRNQPGGYLRFWASLKANFKVGCPAGLAVAALGWAMVKLHGFLYAGAAAGDRTLFACYIAFWIFLVVLCGTAAYIFPVLSRFTFGVGGLLAASVKLALAHPLTTLLLGLLTVGCVLLCVEFWMWMVWLVLPYVWALLASLLLERVFRPFMEEQGEAEGTVPELDDEEE